MPKKKKILHSPTDPQEFPHRFLLRSGDKFYRFIDLQVVSEPNDGLSVYLKPPLGYLYQSRKPLNKVSFEGVSGSQEIKLNNDVTKGQSYFNPYATWHGSGRCHINGYSTTTLEQEIVLNDSQAISLSEIAVPPHVLFTGLFPLNTLSHIETSPPPVDFEDNYIEISDKPYRQNEINKSSTVHYVLDIASLRAGSLVMDVMVHNRGVNVDVMKNLPYPADSEMYFVAQPLKIAPSNSLCPAVTVFFYQPVGENDGNALVQKEPSTLWLRSKGTQADQFVQFEPL